MTTYAAQLLSRFPVGHDGHTPHERLRGKPLKVLLPEFRETVWRHLPVKNVHRDERGKLKVRWEKATFLALAPMTNEFYWWDGTKMVKARKCVGQRLQTDGTRSPSRRSQDSRGAIMRMPHHLAPFLKIKSRPPQIQFRKLCHKSETFMSARATATTWLHGGVWEV